MFFQIIMEQSHLHKKEKKLERRRYLRSRCDRIIAFTCEASTGKNAWLVGRLLDAGLGGVKIRLTQTVSLTPGQELDFICLPDMEIQGTWQDPIHILAKIAWRDDHGNYLGLEYI